MISSKPSVLLYTGSFSPVDLYDNLREAVVARGVDFRVLALPTVRLGLDDKRNPPSMYDDAANLVSEVELLADEGKDVILIAHSYSGTPVSEAASGLGKASMAARGKRGGVVGVAYVTALVPKVGESAAEVLAVKEGDPAVTFEQTPEGWFKHADVEQVARSVFTDLPFDEAIPWAKSFSHHSVRSFADPLTKAGYVESDIALSYLLCEADAVVPPLLQRAGIDLMEKESGKKVAVTSIDADHVPMIRHVDQVADWIVNLVGPRR